MESTNPLQKPVPDAKAKPAPEGKAEKAAPENKAAAAKKPHK